MNSTAKLVIVSLTILMIGDKVALLMVVLNVEKEDRVKRKGNRRKDEGNLVVLTAVLIAYYQP